MTKVFLTGATGVMGMAGLRCLLSRPSEYEVTVLARPGRTNSKKLAEAISKGVKVLWGDLLDPAIVTEGVKNADIVLHVGGMVSPAADWHPARTYEVNTRSVRNIVDAVKTLGQEKHTKVVYIGSVAQYGDYLPPHHWGGVGDPMSPAAFDAYALSKIEGERILTESGIDKWVSLRQTSILHKGLLTKADQPTMFHVPLRGVLEWISDEDSGRLLERVCRPDVPDSFWRNFYDVGGGESFRMTNYEFEARLLKAIGSPPPEKIFETKWFATRNFHGMWFRDSDCLENILHFRSGESASECFNRLASESPWWIKLTPLAPAFIIKSMMKRVAYSPQLGTMWWIKNNIKDRIDAAFGKWEGIPEWKDIDLSDPDRQQPHSEQETDISEESATKAASRRGGQLIGKFTDPDTLVELECSHGHRFSLTPRALVRGGHWCGECLRHMARAHEYIPQPQTTN